MGRAGEGKPRHAIADMSRIKLSDTARSDIRRIYDFLAQFDVAVADNLVGRIIHQKEWYDAQTIGLADVAS